MPINKTTSKAVAAGNIVNINLADLKPKTRRRKAPAKKKAKAPTEPPAPTNPLQPRFRGSGRVGSKQEARQPYIGMPSTAAALASMVGGYVKTSQPTQIDTLDAIRGRVNKLEAELDRRDRAAGLGFARSLHEAAEIQQRMQSPLPTYDETIRTQRATPIISEYQTMLDEEKKENPSIQIGGSQDNADYQTVGQKLKKVFRRIEIFDEDDIDEEEERVLSQYAQERKEAEERQKKTAETPPPFDVHTIVQNPQPISLAQGVLDRVRSSANEPAARVILNQYNVSNKGGQTGPFLYQVAQLLGVSYKKDSNNYKAKQDLINDIMSKVKLPM